MKVLSQDVESAFSRVFAGFAPQSHTGMTQRDPSRPYGIDRMGCRIKSGRTREGSACLILTYPFSTRLIALIRVRKDCFLRIHRKIFRKKVAETLAGLKERRTFAPAIEKRRQVVER